MSTINALLVSFGAGMSTLLGGLIIFFNIKEKNINKFITLCLSFSIAIMIGISITDLLPTSLFTILFNIPTPLSYLIIILAFSIGVLIVYLISKLISKQQDSLYKLGILSMVALIIHNFPEGIATFMGSVEDVSLGLKLGLAIMFHNIPEGISIAVPIYYATKSKGKALFHTLLSGLAEPLGAFLSFLFLKNYINNLMISIILLLVAGIMITLSIEEMFPKCLAYKENKYIYLGLSIGTILILLNHFLM